MRMEVPKQHDGNYLTVILPVIPACDPILLKTDDNLSFLPKLLQRPLCKKSDGKIFGIQSGIRSGIIYIDEKYYRLKGCGNNYDGFPFRSVPDSHRDDIVEIRGCTFSNTSSRELIYSTIINKILCDHGLPICNVPLGWMEYELPNTPLKKIKRICTLFETSSDKRLSDHLLTGLERILSLFYKEEDRKFFEEDRYDGGRAISTGFAFQCDMKLVDLVCLDVSEVFPTRIHSNVALDRVSEWRECVSILESSKELSNGLFAQLYWCLGREVGVIQGLLAKYRISWGTYEDKLGLHCNSHANNLCVLPPGSSRFLSPLDFDMAYKEDSFDRYSNAFEDWLRMEERAQAMSLGGGDWNSGVKQEEFIESIEVNNFRYALRDTMVLGFYNGLKDDTDLHPIDEKLRKSLDCLIKLALMTTEDVIA